MIPFTSNRANMNEKLLDSATVAEIIGLAPTTLAKRRVSGDGPPFVKLGARVLYPARELQEWIEARPRFQNTAQMTVARSRSVR